jgi:hypothetical protein
MKRFSHYLKTLLEVHQTKSSGFLNQCTFQQEDEKNLNYLLCGMETKNWTAQLAYMYVYIYIYIYIC